MSQSGKFAELILPLALKDSFTYAIPEEMLNDVEAGKRALVQFGKQKLYSGIIIEIHSRSPEGFSAKEILSVIDERPLISTGQIQFWKWIAKYYMCSIGEVMNAALPAGLKLASETVFTWNKEPEEESSLQDYDILKYFREECPISLEELRSGPKGLDTVKSARSLLEKGVLSIDQHFRKSFKPKTVSFVELAAEYRNDESLNLMLDGLKKAKAQKKILEIFLQIASDKSDTPFECQVLKSDLLSGGMTGQPLAALVKKGVFNTYDQEVSRLEQGNSGLTNRSPDVLTLVQEIAFKSIQEKFNNTPVVLLHGVTSSGKTQIYMHLIKEQIDAGKQVLYLLPEIALTTQIIQRLSSVFGEHLGVYHSRYSDNERVEVFMNLAGHSDNKPFSLIIGVRSAIFLPFQNLGLVIVDEEHEYTYKQHDPAPRYHARDAVTILAMFSGARVVLGSATPSLESLHNTQTGKYGLVELHERYGNIALPEIVIADVAQARKRKQLKAHLTPELLNGIQDALESGKQVILFQNRRGYSNYMLCETCGYILKCKHCDVSLTYHKLNREMICHYCGYKMPLLRDCPDCGSSLSMRGFGTEKIEEDLAELLPEAKISRLDIDKARSKKGLEKVIGDFESGRSQILVGTQLVSKGLDFENVGLVGIIDADSMMNFPDFRAFERSFHLMVQVSGRAGRRKERGKVIIQTSDPTHPVIQKVLTGAAPLFVEEQLEERKLFKYPPFSRLIRITLKHEIPSILDGGSIFLARELKEIFGSRVLGPQQPMVSRMQGKYVKQVLLKIEKDASFEKSKDIISELIEIFSQNPVYRQIRTNVDVDPL